MYFQKHRTLINYFVCRATTSPISIRSPTSLLLLLHSIGRRGKFDWKSVPTASPTLMRYYKIHFQYWYNSIRNALSVMRISIKQNRSQNYLRSVCSFTVHLERHTTGQTRPTDVIYHRSQSPTPSCVVSYVRPSVALLIIFSMPWDTIKYAKPRPLLNYVADNKQNNKDLIRSFVVFSFPPQEMSTNSTCRTKQGAWTFGGFVAKTNWSIRLEVSTSCKKITNKQKHELLSFRICCVLLLLLFLAIGLDSFSYVVIHWTLIAP